MVDLHWFDTFLISGIAQGVFLSIVLFKKGSWNTPANRILSVILLVTVFLLAHRFMWDKYPTDFREQWLFLPNSIIFLLGPLVYLYTQFLLFQGIKSLRIRFYYFIPSVMHLLIFAYLMTYSNSELQSLHKVFPLKAYYGLTEWLGIMFNTYYWVKTFWTLRAYEKQGLKEGASNQDLIIYLKYFLYAFSVLLLLWVFGYIAWFFDIENLTHLGYCVTWFTIPIFIFLICYYALTRPKLFRLRKNVLLRVKKQIQRLEPEEVEVLKNKLAEAIDVDKVFIKNDLTLDTLAKKLNVSTNDLSWFLNEVCGMSFYQYINKARVDEFLQKIEREQHFNKTFFAMAIEVGFNTKSTFNKSFRQEMHCTPSDYIKKLSCENIDN